MANNKTLEAIVTIAGQLDPSLGKALNNTTKQFNGVKIGIAAVGAVAVATTAAVVKFGSDAVKSAAAFEQQMANVSSLLDGSAEAIATRTQELSKDVLAVSNATGVSSDELSDGLYKIISAVGDSEDAITQMELAAKVAKAGGAETTQAIDLLTAVTKGYNDTSGDAFQKAADLAFMTDKLGQTSVPELASSIGKVIPLSAALGVEQEELFGSFAALTGVTGSTAEVATQMKAVMSGLMSPTDDMASALESLGYANSNAALEALGFQGMLEALGGTVGGDTQALAKLFSSVEAQTAILALAGAQAEDLREKTLAMYEADGAMSSAFDMRTDTLKNTIAVIKNLGKNFVTTVGMTMLPMVKDLAEKALPKIEKFLTSAAPKVQAFFGALMTSISAVYTFSKTYISPIIGAIVSAFKVGFGVVVDVIGTVEDGIGAVYNKASEVFNYLTEHKTVLSMIAIAIGTITTAIGAYTIAQNASAIAHGVATAAMGVYTTATTIASAVVQGGAAVAMGVYTTATTIATAASTAFGAVMAFITSPITLVVLAIGAVIAAGVALYQNWDLIKIKASEIWTRLCEFATGVKDSFATAFSSLVGIVSGPINSIITLINGAIGAINSLAIVIPDWVPMLGGKTFSINIPEIPLLAKGGFTNGPSIAGEAGTEAVISFNRAYRDENLSYWAKAGRMLGVDESLLSAFEKKGTGSGGMNITFAPQITINSSGRTTEQDIINALKDEEIRFMQMLEEMMDRRGGEVYGFNF